LNERKRAWLDLEEDMEAVSKKMRKLEKNCQELDKDKKKLPFIIDILTLQH